MKRYMLHLQNTRSYTPKEATLILHRARHLIEPEASIRDVRVSKKYIEFDISVCEGKEIRSIVETIEVIAPLASFEEITELQKPSASSQKI